MERIEYKIKNLGKFKIIESEIYHTYKIVHMQNAQRDIDKVRI